MGVHTGFWLSGTRSAIVPAIQGAGCLPFSSKCQVKIYASRSRESVAGFSSESVLSFSKYERRRSQSFAMPLALVRKITKAFGVPIANRLEAQTEIDRWLPLVGRSRFGRIRTMRFGWPFLIRAAQRRVSDCSFLTRSA
jgi:hypothetical protein